MNEMNNVHILLWPNGHKREKAISLQINKNQINSLLSLKHYIINSVLHNRRFSIETINLYSHKGIRLDDVDIENLQQNQIIIYCDKSELFSSANQYNLYTFLNKIKSGGYGQVYLAQNNVTNEHVAIKQVNCNELTYDEIETISREQLYMSTLNHRNIIKYRGFFKYENNIYTVMDYAKGGELGKYVREKGKLDENEAKRIFMQIYKGVSHMHTKNLIHRDLKPNNILFLDEDHQQVVIIDFGICGMSNGKNKDVIKAGTLEYSCPEIASGDEFESSPKIDVWSLGVILFYMLYGTLPFKGKNDKEIIFSILYKEPNYKPLQECLSEECVVLLKKMLEKNASFRIRMFDEEFNNWFNSECKSNDIPIRKAVTQVVNSNKKRNAMSVRTSKKKENQSMKPSFEIKPFNYMNSLRGGNSSSNNNVSSQPGRWIKSPKCSNSNAKLNKDFALFRSNDNKPKTTINRNNKNSSSNHLILNKK